MCASTMMPVACNKDGANFAMSISLLLLFLDMTKAQFDADEVNSVVPGLGMLGKLSIFLKKQIASCALCCRSYNLLLTDCVL